MIFSPGFSEFRQLLDLWDENLAKERDNQVSGLIDGNDFIFFFIKDGDIYGGTEDSRVTFARMKNPEDDGESWADEANFIAFNLDKALLGKQIKSVFSKKDLPTLEVIDRNTAEKKLKANARKIKGDSKIKTQFDLDEPIDPTTPPTALKLGDNK